MNAVRKFQVKEIRPFTTQHRVAQQARSSRKTEIKKMRKSCRLLELEFEGKSYESETYLNDYMP